MNNKIKNQNQYSPKNNKRKMNSINNLIFRYNLRFWPKSAPKNDDSSLSVLKLTKFIPTKSLISPFDILLAKAFTNFNSWGFLYKFFYLKYLYNIKHHFHQNNN